MSPLRFDEIRKDVEPSLNAYRDVELKVCMPYVIDETRNSLWIETRAPDEQLMQLATRRAKSLPLGAQREVVERTIQGAVIEHNLQQFKQSKQTPEYEAVMRSLFRPDGQYYGLDIGKACAALRAIGKKWVTPDSFAVALARVERRTANRKQWIKKNLPRLIDQTTQACGISRSGIRDKALADAISKVVRGIPAYAPTKDLVRAISGVVITLDVDVEAKQRAEPIDPDKYAELRNELFQPKGSLRRVDLVEAHSLLLEIIGRDLDVDVTSFSNALADLNASKMQAAEQIKAVQTWIRHELKTDAGPEGLLTDKDLTAFLGESTSMPMAARTGRAAFHRAVAGHFQEPIQNALVVLRQPPPFDLDHPSTVEKFDEFMKLLLDIESPLKEFCDLVSAIRREIANARFASGVDDAQMKKDVSGIFDAEILLQVVAPALWDQVDADPELQAQDAGGFVQWLEAIADKPMDKPMNADEETPPAALKAIGEWRDGYATFMQGFANSSSSPKISPAQSRPQARESVIETISKEYGVQPGASVFNPPEQAGPWAVRLNELHSEVRRHTQLPDDVWDPAKAEERVDAMMNLLRDDTTLAERRRAAHIAIIESAFPPGKEAVQGEYRKVLDSLITSDGDFFRLELGTVFAILRRLSLEGEPLSPESFAREKTNLEPKLDAQRQDLLKRTLSAQIKGVLDQVQTVLNTTDLLVAQGTATLRAQDLPRGVRASTIARAIQGAIIEHDLLARVRQHREGQRQVGGLDPAEVVRFKQIMHSLFHPGGHNFGVRIRKAHGVMCSFADQGRVPTLYVFDSALKEVRSLQEPALQVEERQ